MDSRNKRRREESAPEEAPTGDTAMSAPASSPGESEPMATAGEELGIGAEGPEMAVPAAASAAMPVEMPEAVPEVVPEAVAHAAFGEAAVPDAMPDAAFGEAAIPAAMPDAVPDAAFGEMVGEAAGGDPEVLEEEFGQGAAEAALGCAELPDLQWSGAGDPSLSQDLPFTGIASAGQVEVALSPLWRLSTRLLGDASTRALGLQLRQRFSFFSTCPGAVETLLELIPVLGEEDDEELIGVL